MGNKETVKWIAVMQGKTVIDFEVAEGYGQLGKVLGDKFGLKLRGSFSRNQRRV